MDLQDMGIGVPRGLGWHGLSGGLAEGLSDAQVLRMEDWLGARTSTDSRFWSRGLEGADGLAAGARRRTADQNDLWKPLMRIGGDRLEE